MTTLTNLERLDALAAKATIACGRDGIADNLDALAAALSPKTVLALTRALRAAKDRRKYVSAQEVFVWAEFDAELADLEKL
jgi:hypothetical protein